MDFWDALAQADIKPSALKQRNLDVEATPAPGSKPPEDRILTLFSPRDDKTDLETLNWYAELMGSAKQFMCMTFAFNLDQIFVDALDKPSDALRFVLLDKAIDPDTETEITRNHNTLVAAGNLLKKGDIESFLGEVLTGFNRNRYIHDKFMLVDPLGEDPVVVTGTANFSGNSQAANDENMLVIRSDKRVADIFFGEFMRIFDHFYTRYVVRKIRDQGNLNPDAGFLKETTAEWLPAHFQPGTKEKRRRYFMGT